MHINRYLKNAVSKSIVCVIKHVFMGHTLTELFGKKLTIDDKYISKRV